MRKEYDFSKGRRNPYARRLKRPVTIRIEWPQVLVCAAHARPPHAVYDADASTDVEHRGVVM